MEVDHTRETEVVRNDILVTLTEEEIAQIEEEGEEFAIEDPTTEFGMILFTRSHGDIPSSVGPGITATPRFTEGHYERLRHGETVDWDSAHSESSLGKNDGPSIKVKLE